MREKRIKMQSKPPFVVEILILRSPPWPFTPLFTSNFYYKARGVGHNLDETPPPQMPRARGTFSPAQPFDFPWVLGCIRAVAEPSHRVGTPRGGSPVESQTEISD